MARGPFVDPEVRQIVARWVADGERSPAAIYRAVQRELNTAYEGTAGVQRPGLPTERTIGRLVKELVAQGSPDERAPWSLASATPDEAAVIMPVLGALLADSATLVSRFPDDPMVDTIVRSRRLTVGLATWVLKVAAAAPTLPPYDQYIVAREYRAAVLSAARGAARPWVTDPTALDAFLACRPWESEDAAERYERLLEQGIVKQPIYLGKWWRNILEREQIRRQLAQSSRCPAGEPPPDPGAVQAAAAELRAIQAEDTLRKE
jgi:hypothetical protein